LFSQQLQLACPNLDIVKFKQTTLVLSVIKVISGTQLDALSARTIATCAQMRTLVLDVKKTMVSTELLIVIKRLMIVSIRQDLSVMSA
jgi:hypothetical protein